MKLPLKKYYAVVDPKGRDRLWTVDQDHAIRFAQDVWSTERVVCVINEIQRGNHAAQPARA